MIIPQDNPILNINMEIIKLYYLGKDINEIISTINIPYVGIDYITSVIKIDEIPYTFGVEIECIGKRSDINKALNAEGISCEIQDYNHKIIPFWKIITDSSINYRDSELPLDLKSNNRVYAMELVSPILKGNDGLSILKKVFKILNDNNTYVNDTCGLHIHFGVRNILKEYQIVNVVKAYQILENSIDSFLPNSRKDNVYCRGLKDIELEDCDNMESLFSSFNNNKDNYYRSLYRYSKLNVDCYNKIGTIEFRQHHGTMNFNIVSSWIKLLSELIKTSSKKPLDKKIKDISEVKEISLSLEQYKKNI